MTDQKLLTALADLQVQMEQPFDAKPLILKMCHCISVMSENNMRHMEEYGAMLETMRAKLNELHRAVEDYTHSPQP